ncbi:tRNA (N(6)-L-threonylcarbamoyladenosine(37)-C(2))-methylthiotransferase MtaB [Lachnospiraceae bacterium AM25-11LB]|nr:tRNA (N(6)-L-threonylcarbamoyladenosine(37)-C(2))-methylthiotransferase MtaB [Lachnospiraceae bacterium AM25-22]RGD07231.1 tRNA (N(6)-L-threonylcarbamoyladenosine(37)-C(2))-methylthiotransferase MtaB [Lachnospiraceae bacterium AM25-11LB]RJW07872.1 tRNA (N(6)-L-threonylcarbamoyladenosine(37)-C(2))-methylthiotransferase MtaB [Lachnospiraceae bacterium AM25-40]RJW13107.1 tRNA (N(6)-L-threonylcarbamoyladenosine(37)-C(2))-methylthiotransferase MtaB [Lachnospiraceae bacterium AM25-39]
MKKKVALHNLGCKVNAYELEAMQEMLEKAGYEIVPFAPGADVYIINTCTVTNIADRKSRQMLHKARKMNPEAIVIAAGCYVQAQKNMENIDDAIDIVLGNNRKQDLLFVLENYKKGSGQEKDLISLDKPVEYEELQLSSTGEHTRAYLKVQDGCNQFCSYCIIPYVRGRVRSRRKEEVLEEVLRLTKNGYQEFVLTGIHLSSYGVDCEDNLLELIKAVHEIEGVKRIRLGSLEPRIITEEFAQALGNMPKICPHFHLSLQSGCDATLMRMNRKYSAEEYLEGCRLLRKYFNNPALTTDVIVGFPQESEEEFEQSYKMIESVEFYETHIFKYSRRQGTRAAEMEGQVDEAVKTERSHKLIQLGKEKKQKYMESFLGQQVEILFEETAKIQGEEYWIGYTKEYLKVAAKSKENLENRIVLGKVERFIEEGIFICSI